MGRRPDFTPVENSLAPLLRCGVIVVGPPTPKKDEPLSFRDAVTGVACTAYHNFKVKVGVGSDGIKLPKVQQFLITMQVDESRESAVARYRDKILRLLSPGGTAGMG